MRAGIGAFVVVVALLAAPVHAQEERFLETDALGTDGLSICLVARYLDLAVAGTQPIGGVNLHAPALGVFSIREHLLIRAEWGSLVPTLLRATGAPVFVGTGGIGAPDLYLDGAAFPRVTVGVAQRFGDLGLGVGPYANLVVISDCSTDCTSARGKIIGDVGGAVDVAWRFDPQVSLDGEIANYTMFTGDGIGKDSFGGLGGYASARGLYRLNANFSAFVSPHVELRGLTPEVEGVVVGVQAGVVWHFFGVLTRVGVEVP
ncbi:MAG: hypothetical protein Q8O67_21560 [Deltaproteobacteria bacterium]|nr:hypothetical protein [Deltaproteobacteria bacterium]